MNCRKMMVLTGYRVQFVDLREPKPRTNREEEYILDRKFVDALTLVHISVDEYIRQKYSKAGYHVTHVEKIHGKRVVYADLRAMWADVAPALIGATDQPYPLPLPEIKADAETEARHEE